MGGGRSIIEEALYRLGCTLGGHHTVRKYAWEISLLLKLPLHMCFRPLCGVTTWVCFLRRLGECAVDRRENVMFAQLYGMADPITFTLAKEGYPV